MAIKKMQNTFEATRTEMKKNAMRNVSDNYEDDEYITLTHSNKCG